MLVDEGQLESFLIDSGLITRSQLAHIERGEQPLYRALAEQNIIAEDELRRAVAHASGTQFIVFTQHDIAQEALMLIPEPVCRAHNLVAYRLDGESLEVALLDLDDLEQVASLNLPYKIKPRLTSRGSVKAGLLYYQKILKEKFGSLLKQGAEVVDALLHHALLMSARGIHVDRTATTLVRYRIGEVLHEAFELPQHIGSQLVDRLKTLAKLLPASSTLQEGRFKFDREGEGHIVHVSALPTMGGERLVLRLARERGGQQGFSLTALGLHGSTLEEVHKLLNKKSGLVLVAGPDGGGKTTTLYTLLDQLPHHNLAIASVEDKIEHTFPYVAQTQTRPEVGLTTSAALRAVLKQDPDVVIVGEIKDNDTAALVLSAAQRGVLSIAGISAPTYEGFGVATASAGVEKMRGFGVSPHALATALKGVIGVQAVKKLCPHESEQYRLSRAESAPLEDQADFGKVLANLKEEKIIDDSVQWKELLFARAVKCSKCADGYQGMIGLQEVLPNSGMIKEMILSGASTRDIEMQAREEGMSTSIEDGLFKAAQNLTSVEEIFKLL